METRIQHPYWYKTTFSCPLLLLVVYELVFALVLALIPLPGFYPRFSLPVRHLSIFTLLICYEVAELLIILCVLCLTNTGFVHQCYQGYILLALRQDYDRSDVSHTCTYLLFRLTLVSFFYFNS